MMRNIKFRAWYEDEIVEITQLNLETEEHTVFDGIHEYICNINEKYVMQYTGFKDINGVNIYEGDIVKVNYNDAPEVKIITYHNASFGIRDNEMGFVPLAIFERPSKNLIVLGNIYENPELLGDSQ